MKLNFNVKLIYIFIVVIITYFSCDYTIYLLHKINFIKEIQEINTKIEVPSYYLYFIKNYGLTISSFKSKYINGHYSDFREPDIIANADKGSILLFGCSFAYGTGLNDDETFSKKLSVYTNRTVYNMALESGGIQHMYYFLNDENFFKNIKQIPEYAIYIYTQPF